MAEFDAVAVIEASIAKLADKFEEAQSAWQSAEESERKQIETELEDIKKQIKGLTEAATSRPSVPGVEVAAPGEKNTAGRKFSFGRMAKLLCGTASGDDPEYGYEMEVNREAEKALDKPGDDYTTFKTAINTGTDSAGGFFYIPHEVQSTLVPYLESQEIGIDLGVTVINGLVGNVSWVVDEGVPVAYYVDTEGEESVTESVNTFSNIEMRPRVLAAAVPLSWGMQHQPARAIDTWLMERIGRQFALKEDNVLFNGTGAQEPLGLLNHSGVNTHTWTATVRFGDATNRQTVTNELRLQLKAIADQNALPFNGGRLGWATDTNGYFAFPQVQDDRALPIFVNAGDAPLNQLFNYPIRYSTQLDSGDNTDQTLLVGDFSQAIIGRWGTMAFAASTETETNFRKFRKTIRGHMAHDVSILQPKAFCKASGFDVSSVV